jgi:protein-L-isoaspartate O-methyltransferase
MMTAKQFQNADFDDITVSAGVCFSPKCWAQMLAP